MEKPIAPQDTIKKEVPKESPKKEDKKVDSKKFCPYCGHALE